MLRLLNSVELQAISTRKQFIDFTRDAIPKDDGINLSFIIELGVNDNEEDKLCYLILGCKSQVNDVPEGEVNPLKVEITIAYKFNVLDPDVFHQADDELKATLLSNLVYLDFRSKLTATFSSVGLSKIRFPLTFEKIKAMS